MEMGGLEMEVDEIEENARFRHQPLRVKGGQ